MKFTLSFKTPDVMDQMVDAISEEELKEAKKFAAKFMEYDEYIFVEFDTVAQTAKEKKK